ncbi:MAG: helix-turn-helix domain-containing protein [Gammaproteobacteria bacterium]|nr:helix-turn-helix domain-containing protein [Gammaproteobacteria bacterium]
MREVKQSDCTMCGLHRVCFPARAVKSAGRANESRIRRLRVARGHILYRGGERIESLYMVRSGCITEIDGIESGSESIANFCLPGELLTVQSTAASGSRTTCRAVEASFVCAVPWRIVEHACATLPAVAGELIDLIATAGAATRELLTMVRDKGALQRVAGFALNIGARMQARAVPGRDFRLGMSREEIARYLGLRSETVSRCFSELARRGLIEVSAKRVKILAHAELRELFRGDAAVIAE